eukprot:c8890_g1_i1 orf=74-304(+)
MPLNTGCELLLCWGGFPHSCKPRWPAVKEPPLKTYRVPLLRLGGVASARSVGLVAMGCSFEEASGHYATPPPVGNG